MFFQIPVSYKAGRDLENVINPLPTKNQDWMERIFDRGIRDLFETVRQAHAHCYETTEM